MKLEITKLEFYKKAFAQFCDKVPKENILKEYLYAEYVEDAYLILCDFVGGNMKEVFYDLNITNSSVIESIDLMWELSWENGNIKEIKI